MSISLGQAIERLEKLRANITRTRPFFIDHLRDWMEIARSTARTVLLAQTPAGLEQEQWHRQVDYTLGLMGAQLLGGEASGLLLYLGRQQTSFDGFVDTVGQVLSAEVTFQDIVDYVQAGLEGDPAGKQDVTAEDRGRPAEQTAFLIQRALRLGTSKNQRDEKVAEFVTARLERELVRDYLPAIQQVWKETFSVLAYDAMRRWVAREARRS